MVEESRRTHRTLLIADHLWDAFGRMAVEMGNDREGLINQALHSFARQHGYLQPGEFTMATGSRPPPATDSALEAHASTLAAAAARGDERPQAGRAHASPERLAELERQLAGAAVLETPPAGSLRAEQPSSSPPPPPALSPAAGSAPAPANPFEPDASLPAEDPPRGRSLVLLADGRELDRVMKDRFLIGRGRHCDLIINSGKVSREHAAIVRDGDAYFMEDLGSSNGTWFEKKRITRRRIEDGDDYFICAEKLSCTFR